MRTASRRTAAVAFMAAVTLTVLAMWLMADRLYALLSPLRALLN